MKKNILMAFMAGTIAAGILFAGTVPGHAVGMSVGANMWYVQWKTTPSSGNDIDPGLMYGPVLGLDLAKKWSLTSVLLTGNFKLHADDAYSPQVNYRRYDSDTTLNYSINKWLKVFGGFKYVRYDMKLGSLAEMGDLLMPFESGDFKHLSYGPGAGIGITLPLSDSFFLLGNGSLLYLYGKNSTSAAADSRFIDKGYNATLILAYYLDSISTTLSAGGRYQYFREENAHSNDTTMRFYGVTVSAIYHFNLGNGV
ncbi:MAG: hypothetical protein EPN93_00830 [Spirochaetes bacterium]|nr:MAG: hypothetical protein EPN93_00830 [Spirochaetota bacterium]